MFISNKWMLDIHMICGLLYYMINWLVHGLIDSSMGSTKSTKEVPGDGRPHACWPRDRSRNMAAILVAMGGRTMDMATVKTDTTVDTSTAIAAGNGTGISSTWRKRLLMSREPNSILCPPWRRNAPTPSAEVSSSEPKGNSRYWDRWFF